MLVKHGRLCPGITPELPVKVRSCMWHERAVAEVFPIGTLLAKLQLLSRARGTKWWGSITAVIPF